MATEELRREEMSEIKQLTEVKVDEVDEKSTIKPDIDDPVVEVENLYLKYGEKEALTNIWIEIQRNPSGNAL